MATLIHPSGIRKDLPRMTVQEARAEGYLPQVYVPVEKDPRGHSRLLDDSEFLQGEYSLIPRNRAG